MSRLMTGPMLLLVSCGGGGGGGGAPPPMPPADPVLAEALIGPNGGFLTVTVGPDAGLRLSVPAGAVAVETQFRVFLDLENGEIPSLFPVYRFEPQSIDFSLSPLTVTVPAGDVLFASVTPTLTTFTRVDNGAPWQALVNTTVDVVGQTVTSTASRLGDFVAWEGYLHRLFAQDYGIYDPSAPVRTEFLYGVEVAVDNGSILREVGAGSLASFWNSTASDNALVLHGVIGSPLDLLGTEDLVANLQLTKSNVVLLTYPSARGVAYAANELYDLIAANGQPGFGCSIVGHSIGGLIGRYLIERSATDPERRGFQEGDASLAGIIDHLVMIGVPNAGAESSTQAFAAIEASLPESERWMLRVAEDLSEELGSLSLSMNASYTDNATRYHVIYGDLGTGSDGVITTASALALPMTFPETTTMFVAAHDELHRQATQLGIGVLIGTLLQGQ